MVVKTYHLDQKYEQNYLPFVVHSNKVTNLNVMFKYGYLIRQFQNFPLFWKK